MSTIWYDMGIRGEEFCGVNPCTFLNAGARFFFKLKHLARKSLLPGYTPDEKELNFSFSGVAKWKEYLDWGNSACRRKFLYSEVPLGVPLARDIWESSGTEWPKEVLAPSLESVLDESPVTLPQDPYWCPSGCMHTGNLDWQKQLLKLIRAMRYCIIPLEITYQRTDGTWYEWFGGSGCVNNANYKWKNVHQFVFKVPDLWGSGGRGYKIGVYARNLTPEYPVPVEGTFWKNTKEYRITVGENRYGASELRIYGAADLSCHPEFEEYFDNEPEQ